MDLVLAVLVQLLIQLPTYVVWVVGIFLAVTRRDEHPTGYPLVAIGLGIFLVISVISTIVNVNIPLYMASNGISASQIGVLLAVFNVFHMIVSTIAWVLILVALFRRRVAAPTSTPSVDTVNTF